MKISLFFLISFLGISAAYSQSVQTPFSSRGLGEIYYPGTLHNDGMGGISISYPSSYCYNLMNPAMLVLNGYTSFDVGSSFQTRFISNGSSSSRNTSGNIKYVALGFPVKRNFWSSGFSLSPYSYVNYDINSVETVSNTSDTAIFNFNGSGGINSLSWSNGFLFFKSLAIGAKISYLFGSEINVTTIRLPSANAYNSAIYNSNNIHDFNLNLGLDYRFPLSDKYAVHIGGIYETANNLNLKHTERLERRQPDNNIPITTDSLLTDKRGSIYLPERYGIGLTLVKNAKWVFGVEYLTQNWSKFKNYYNVGEGLLDSKRYASGIEFIPNANSINKYFSRVVYRAGVYYNQSQYMVDKDQVNEIGINFGVSLPVSRPSLVNLAFQFGRRSSNGKIAINENFIGFSLGLTYNDIWFIRRRID